MADFIGFTFKNVHSSAYHLYRTSDGDRYNINLLPELENKSTEIVGGDGDLYESMKYKKTEFTIKVAYDSVTEKDLRNIKRWLAGADLGEFRFDECPYKTYFVKISGKPEFNYICFDEDDDLGQSHRIYKGEGSIKFVAFDPFGYAIDNTISITSTSIVTNTEKVNWQLASSYRNYNVYSCNISEWQSVADLFVESATIGTTKYNIFTKSDIGNSFTCNTHNPGDFESDFEILLTTGQSLGDITFCFYEGEYSALKSPKYTFTLSLSSDSKIADNVIIKLDSKKRAVYVTQNNVTSLRYDLVSSSIWPRVCMGDGAIRINANDGLIKDIKGIKYNYKYL